MGGSVGQKKFQINLCGRIICNQGCRKLLNVFMHQSLVGGWVGGSVGQKKSQINLCGRIICNQGCRKRLT